MMYPPLFCFAFGIYTDLALNHGMARIKKELGKEYRAKRSQMNFQLRERESVLACERLTALPEWQEAQSVMIYIATDDEVDTRSLIQTLLANDAKAVHVPFIEDTERGIEVSTLTEYGHLAEGRFGILEPRPRYRTIADPETIDLVVVPGLVFDRRGGRIGYGHGYYDKFLSRTDAVRVGIGYEFQVLQEIPQASHDMHMNIIVTASETIRAT